MVDFIGIGAPKCGTTSLAAILNQHPAVCGPANHIGKEVNYFTAQCGNRAHGVSWYLEHFAAARSGQIKGEISPVYFTDPDAPRWIRAAFPEAKLIAILRDPVRRAYSSFIANQRSGRIPAEMSFEQALAADPVYEETSRYHEHLARYLHFFPREQLLVLFLEELQAVPDRELPKLFAFLGIEAMAPAELDLEPRNQAWLPRSPHGLAMLKRVKRGMQALGLGEAAASLQRVGLPRVLPWLGRPPQPLSPAEYARAAPRFRDSDQSLRELLALESLPWSGRSG